LGTRESRHLIARYQQLTEDEVLRPGPPHDAVALDAWPMEYHPGPGLPSAWTFIGDPGYYGIPLDILRSRDTHNLLAAGRTVDGDRGTGASLGVMGTAFATGHAAGIAAALTADMGDAPTAAVRAELNRQDARLPVPPTSVPRRLVRRDAAMRGRAVGLLSATVDELVVAARRGHTVTAGSRYRGIGVAPDPDRWLAVMCRGLQEGRLTRERAAVVKAGKS
jgi:hypothetical protein